jgi:hypothetical protein
MRQAINENRTVQLALLAVLLLGAAFFLLKPKGGGSESTAATPPATTAPGTTPAPAATTPGAVPAPVTTTPAVSGAAAATVPANLVPGKGLPKSLVPAYNNGKGIVLLVRRKGGIDDAFVHEFLKLLGQTNYNNRVKTYVTTAQHIARYSWLTMGANVTELPALVVLLPKKLSDGAPTATVSYGFRFPASVVQAVKDSLYNGPTRPYHPQR